MQTDDSGATRQGLTRRAMLGAVALLPAASALGQPAAGAPDPESLLAVHERETGGRVGVFARNLATGATLAWRAEERFPVCSTFKASLAACVLARVDRAEERLDRVVPYGPADILDYAPVAKQNLEQGSMTVAALCEAAVELSDNICANLLLAAIGGPAALTDFWRRNGDPVSRLDDPEPLLNRLPAVDDQNTTMPLAMAGNLRRYLIGDVLSPASRQQLKDWMIGCKTGDALLRAGLPKGWVVADKTGSCAKDIIGDIAVVWPYPDRPILVCGYAQGGTPSLPQLQSVFADLGRIVGATLG
ncbi:MAG: class A beta-lactamase [Alphaproteobacteria bacterium]|nr:class A beta-lactamase [Alphaproteobacteria bacterium]